MQIKYKQFLNYVESYAKMTKIRTRELDKYFIRNDCLICIACSLVYNLSVNNKQ